MKKSRVIALCGLTAALGTIFLVISQYSQLSQLSFLALSGFVLFLPLSKGIFKGSILVFIATAVLGFIFGAPLCTVAYLMFFGIYPLLCVILLKILPKQLILRYLIICGYAIVAMIIGFWLLNLIEFFGFDYPKEIIMAACIFALILYHFLCEKLYFKLPILLARFGIK